MALPVYTAFLSVVLCMVCLAGTTWAWFTATQEVSVDPIAAAQYGVTVSVEGSGYTEGQHQGNMRCYTLTPNQSYDITLSAAEDSTASTGYCLVALGDAVYYTSPITKGSPFSFAYGTGMEIPEGLTGAEFDQLIDGAQPTGLTVAWYWGTYPDTQGADIFAADTQYAPLGNGAVLGTPPAQAPLEAELALNLTGFVLPEDLEADTIPLCEDYSLVLTPDEGYELPEVVTVEIDEEVYEVYTDGQEHREIPVDEEGNPDPRYLNEEGEPDLSLLPPMPTFDPETRTLTISAELLPEQVLSVTVTAAAEKSPECTCENKCTEPSEDCPVCKESIENCTGKEEAPKCTCENKCTEPGEDCPVCKESTENCTGKEEVPKCTCEIKCTEPDADCPVCKESTENCTGKEEAPKCTCEIKCTGPGIDCPVCKESIETCTGKEEAPKCTCENKCTEPVADCPACKESIDSCNGKEAEAPTAPETTEPPVTEPQTTEPPTEAPTDPAAEPETQPPTDPVQPTGQAETPTEPSTEPATEPGTEPATEGSTGPSTGAAEEAPTGEPGQ